MSSWIRRGSRARCNPSATGPRKLQCKLEWLLKASSVILDRAGRFFFPARRPRGLLRSIPLHHCIPAAAFTSTSSLYGTRSLRAPPILTTCRVCLLLDSG